MSGRGDRPTKTAYPSVLLFDKKRVLLQGPFKALLTRLTQILHLLASMTLGSDQDILGTKGASKPLPQPNPP